MQDFRKLLPKLKAFDFVSFMEFDLIIFFCFMFENQIKSLVHGKLIIKEIIIKVRNEINEWMVVEIMKIKFDKS